MAAKFPKWWFLFLVTSIVCLILIAYRMLSQHQPLTGTMLDILRGQEAVVQQRKINFPEAGDPTVRDDLYKRIRILCLIPTSTPNLHRKAATVRDTWGRRCNKVLFFAEKSDQNFPTIGLGEQHEGLKQLTSKVRAALTYVHDNHYKDADWFLKADDDTYVIVENLRFFLSHYDGNAPLYFGHHFRKYSKQGYMSGGAGYVLSKEALRRLVREGYHSEAAGCRKTVGAEDASIGQCLESVGVKTGISLDSEGKQTFHPFNLLSHLSGTYPAWYYEYSKYQVKQGSACCSDFSISFHFVEPNVMRMMEHLLYNTQVYGLQQGIPHRRVFGILNNNKTKRFV